MNLKLCDSRPGKAMVWLVLLLVILAVLAGGGWWYADRVGWPAGGTVARASVAKVISGPLSVTVKESGTIRARQKLILRSKVPGRVAIISIVSEGKRVKKGDLLIVLDDSSFQDQLVEQEIRVETAKAGFVRATEELAVTENQARSDFEQAELDLDLAKLDLKKYEQGEYPRDVKDRKAKIKIAEAELAQAKDTVDWSRKLESRGHITESKLRADELDYQRKTLNVELAKVELDLLMNYVYKRSIKEKTARVNQAEQALDRTARKNRAQLAKAQADLKAKEAELKRQESKLASFRERIENCRLYAPADGMVVYATTGGHRWRNNDPLEPGVEVRERQELIHMPLKAEMIAEIKVPESQLSKLARKQRATVVIDALAGRQFQGTVKKIALIADPGGWWNNNIKLYSTEILLQGDQRGLRTGMNCRATVHVKYLPKTLSVPIQSVVKEHGRSFVYLPNPTGKPKPVAVQTGLDDNVRVQILSGLQEGQLVLLNPPLTRSKRPTASPGDAGQSQAGLPAETQLAETQSAATRPALEPELVKLLELLKRLQDHDRLDTMLERSGADRATRQAVDRALKSLDDDELVLDEQTISHLKALVAKIKSRRPSRERRSEDDSSEQ